MINRLTSRRDIRFLSFLCCLVYFVSYLTRLNYAACLAEVQRSLNISKSLAGLPVTGCFITYGIGQLLCGFMGDRFHPRDMIFTGLTATSVCNLLAALFPRIEVIIPIWCFNGFFQSMLWPPLVRVMAEGLDEEHYKKCCVQVSVASSAGMIAVYVLAPVCIFISGWRLAFIFPGLLGIATAFFWLLSFTRLQSDGTNTVSALNVEMDTDYTIKLPALFLQASLIPILLASTSLSILTTAVLPIFSIFSITIASWLLQKLHNELFTAGILFVIGTLSSLLLLPFYQSLPVFSITMMTLITGCMYGINLLLISRVPRHFARFGRVATISGILNASTYIGSSLSTYAFGAISERFGWFYTIAVWVLVALGGALLCFFTFRKWERFSNPD